MRISCVVKGIFGYLLNKSKHYGGGPCQSFSCGKLS